MKELNFPYSLEKQQVNLQTNTMKQASIIMFLQIQLISQPERQSKSKTFIYSSL
jgi:hypothetical protein